MDGRIRSTKNCNRSLQGRGKSTSCIAAALEMSGFWTGCPGYPHSHRIANGTNAVGTNAETAEGFILDYGGQRNAGFMSASKIGMVSVQHFDFAARGRD